MNLQELLILNKFKQLTNTKNLNKTIKSYYSGDLLSWVMGHVKEKNTLLFTVINSMNVIAVASLLDMCAVVFCEGVEPNDDVIYKANSIGIALFSTNLNSIEAYRLIYNYENKL